MYPVFPLLILYVVPFIDPTGPARNAAERPSRPPNIGVVLRLLVRREKRVTLTLLRAFRVTSWTVSLALGPRRG